MYILREQYGYSAIHDKMIQDCIMVGLYDAYLSDTLQLKANLMLEKAVTQDRQIKSVKQQQSLVHVSRDGLRQLDKDADS